MMRRCVPLLFILLSLSSRSQAENNATGELSAYTGILMGLGTRAAVGATTGYISQPYLITLFDFAYSPVGTETIRTIAPPGVNHSRLYDLSLGVHIQVPGRRRWTPYGILAASMVCTTYDDISTGKGRQSAFFGFQTGGGLRYFISDNWGVRSELKVIVSHRTFTRLGFGVFYQFSD